MLSPGEYLAHYRLVEKLGTGGMGEVYRAKDTRLRRDVAIKILPADFAADPGRIARFEREARTLAALNHPNIATLHGFEQAKDVRFLVMELVEGEDLATRLRRGPLPVEEAIPIFIQIADGLEAAHERGIIHRDLKPANIMVTADGRVKVLDFGLAKGTAGDAAAASGDPSQSPTKTVSGTMAGAMLGTAPYMSPEQVRAKHVDRRADIWAFGCVLSECLSGRPAFVGETVPDILGAILEKDPDWSRLPAKAGRALRALMTSCLVKDARRRLRDIGDARVTLERLQAGDVEEVAAGGAPSGGAEAVGGAAAKRRRRMTVVWLLAGALLGAALLEALRPMVPGPPHRKFEIVVGETPEAVDLEPAVSRNGRRIAYQRGGRLWLRDLDDLEPRPLPGTEGGRMPFWSPDGAWIGFHAGGQLLKLPASGGSSTIIASPGDRISRYGQAIWAPNDRIVLTTGGGGLLEVSAGGGEPATILEPSPDLDFHHIGLLPDGRGILFLVHSPPDIMDSIDLFADGVRKNVLRIEGASLKDPIYSPTGHLLFVRLVDEIGLWAAPFSLEELRVTGEPFLIDSLGRHPSVSANGLLVYARGSDTGRHQLAWVDRAGRALETLTEPQRRMLYPAISADGRQIAFTELLVGGTTLWIQDTGGRNRTRFSHDGEYAYGPTWSPDGRRIAYVITDAPLFFTEDGRIVVRSTEGGGEARELGVGSHPHFSPDGRYLVFSRKVKESKDLFLISLETGETSPIVATGANETRGRISPDGKYLAYTSDESGRGEVYVTRFPSGEGRWQVSSSGGRDPHWSGTGDRLFFLRAPVALMAADVSLDPQLQLDPPRELFRAKDGEVELFMGYDVGSQGDRFLVVRFHVPEPRIPSLAVVENWAAEFASGR